MISSASEHTLDQIVSNSVVLYLPFWAFVRAMALNIIKYAKSIASNINRKMKSKFFEKKNALKVKSEYKNETEEMK